MCTTDLNLSTNNLNDKVKTTAAALLCSLHVQCTLHTYLLRFIQGIQKKRKTNVKWKV